jgi:hypothetical protein
MGINHAGQKYLPLAIEEIIDLGWTPVEAFQQLGDAAIIIKHKAGKANHAPILANRDAIDIVDQRIGQRRSSDQRNRG